MMVSILKIYTISPFLTWPSSKDQKDKEIYFQISETLNTTLYVFQHLFHKIKPFSILTKKNIH